MPSVHDITVPACLPALPTMRCGAAWRCNPPLRNLARAGPLGADGSLQRQDLDQVGRPTGEGGRRHIRMDSYVLGSAMCIKMHVMLWQDLDQVG